MAISLGIDMFGGGDEDPPPVVTSPLDIFLTTPPVLWVRADLGAVGSDQSGHGNDLATYVLPPTVNASDASLSGKKTLSFAVGQALERSLVYAPPFTMLLIAKPVTWASTNVLFGDVSGRGIANAGTTPAVYQFGGSFVNNSNAALGSWHRFRGKFTNSTADALKVGANTEVTGANAGPYSGVNIGLNLHGGAGIAAIDFFECILLPGLPTVGELTQYDTYCAGLSASISL